MLSLVLAAGAGLWLMAAPQVLGYGDPAGSLHHVLGPLIASVACVACSDVVRPLRRLVVVLGLAAAVLSAVPPFAAPAPLFNGIVAGAVAATLAFVAPDGTTPYGGGWRAVLRGGVPGGRDRSSPARDSSSQSR